MSNLFDEAREALEELKKFHQGHAWTERRLDSVWGAVEAFTTWAMDALVCDTAEEVHQYVHDFARPAAEEPLIEEEQPGDKAEEAPGANAPVDGGEPALIFNTEADAPVVADLEAAAEAAPSDVEADPDPTAKLPKKGNGKK